MDKEKIAELVGLSFGDGSLTKRKSRNRLRFQLRGDCTEDKEHYDNYILPLFNEQLMVPLFKRKANPIFCRGKTKSYGLSVESNKLGLYLNKIGIPIGEKKELKIPQWIKQNKKYTTAFLRGLLDTDGTVFCQKNYSVKYKKFHTQIRLKITCCSKVLMKDVFHLLKRLNIKCFFKKYVKIKLNEKDLYTVELNGGVNIKKWFKLIGSNNPKHYSKFEIWQEFGFCPPHTTLEQRHKVLKGETNPYKFYAGVAESGQMRYLEGVVA